MKQRESEAIIDFWNNIERSGERPWGTKVDIRDLHVLTTLIKNQKVSVPNVKWIWLRRRDKISQSISLYRSQQSGIWHIHKTDDEETKVISKTDIDIPVEFMSVAALLYYLVDTTWENFFSRYNIKPYIVFYEDFIDPSTWDSMVAGIFDYLDIDYTLPLNVTTAILKRSPEFDAPNYTKLSDYLHDTLFKDMLYSKEFWR